MGNTVRSCLVLSIAFLASMTTPALAQGTPNAPCNAACNSFVSEFVGNSEWPGRLRKQQRAKALRSIGRLVRDCSTLCGLHVAELDLLTYLEAALSEFQGRGEQQNASRPASSPPRLPSLGAVASPVPTSSQTPLPVSTPAPLPTVVVTVAPVVTSVPSSDPPFPYPYPGGA
jgi:hypothetical protein